MHYNIALLPKKVTNLVTFMESNVLCYFFLYLFFLFKKQKKKKKHKCYVYLK